MGATITDGSTTITPALVLGYETSQTGGNVVHEILGRADPDVTLRPAGLRKGTLNLFFLTVDDVEAARAFHAQAAVFTYADTDIPAVGMSYVLDAGGSLDTALDEFGVRWTLAVAYQEVSP